MRMILPAVRILFFAPLATMHDRGQGVVTYMSPVEAFATAIKFFDRQKVCLIAPPEALDRLIFNGQRSYCSRALLIVDF